MDWNIAEIVSITEGRLVQGDPMAVIRKFSTDSRTAAAGAFFVPLKGPRFDGHQFIEQASQAGAIGYFKEPGYDVKSPGISIEVKEALPALQKIAARARESFKGPVVAITGSNGKTTTKEMLNAVLSGKIPLLKTEGNLNNHIGLPLTLLKLAKTDRLILLEMGINHPGELRALCAIARPTLGIITSIGETHLEGFGSIEGVAEAKGELLDFLDDGVAVLNRDSPFFSKLKGRERGKVISFGLSEDADVRGVALTMLPHGISFILVYEKKEYPVHLSIPGPHNVLNALAAAAAALTLGWRPGEIADGLARFQSVPLRSEIIDLTDEVKVISDAYNANPASMEAALQMLSDIGNGEKRKTVAILGDMLELGQSSKTAHYQLGRTAARFKIRRLFLYGPESTEVLRGAVEGGISKESVALCPSHEAIAEEVKKLFSERLLVLIKGSRGMKMENVLSFLRNG
jgi:UDP-N-acetylmuramoyl-tripeptide--D-alanyl-D-alanine ligase